MLPRDCVALPFPVRLARTNGIYWDSYGNGM